MSCRSNGGVAALHRDAMAYARAAPFLADLRECRGRIGDADYVRLKRRAVSGDISGAVQELAQLKRQSHNTEQQQEVKE